MNLINHFWYSYSKWQSGKFSIILATLKIRKPTRTQSIKWSTFMIIFTQLDLVFPQLFFNKKKYFLQIYISLLDLFAISTVNIKTKTLSTFENSLLCQTSRIHEGLNNVQNNCNNLNQHSRFRHFFLWILVYKTIDQYWTKYMRVTLVRTLFLKKKHCLNTKEKVTVRNNLTKTCRK